MSEFSYLRSMTEDDLAEVWQIEKSAYEFPWSLKGFENALNTELEGSVNGGLNYVFCNDRQQILGYASFITVLDEAQLLNFCVSTEFQGQGIARQALGLLIEKLSAAEFTRLLLEVRVSNQPARRLYASFGFVEDGIRKNYYPAWVLQDGEKQQGKEDAILMSKVLQC